MTTLPYLLRHLLGQQLAPVGAQEEQQHHGRLLHLSLHVLPMHLQDMQHQWQGRQQKGHVAFKHAQVPQAAETLGGTGEGEG